MKVEIRETADLALTEPVIIEGFPGIGMIGTIGASYLADSLQMKLVGYFTSPQFPPIAAIHDYKPVSPARIYASEKHNLIVLFSEFVIPSQIVYPLTQAILEYAHGKDAKMIYSLAGVATPTPESKIYGIPSTPAVAETLKSHGIELIKEGATQGVSGVLIAECAAQEMPAANIMVQTSASLDPRGAATLLDKLSEIIAVPIDTKQLLTEADKVEAKLKESFEKMQTLHDKYKGMEQNPMYA